MEYVHHHGLVAERILGRDHGLQTYVHGVCSSPWSNCRTYSRTWTRTTETDILKSMYVHHHGLTYRVYSRTWPRTTDIQTYLICTSPWPNIVYLGRDYMSVYDIPQTTDIHGIHKLPWPNYRMYCRTWPWTTETDILIVCASPWPSILGRDHGLQIYRPT